MPDNLILIQVLPKIFSIKVFLVKILLIDLVLVSLALVRHS